MLSLACTTFVLRQHIGVFLFAVGGGGTTCEPVVEVDRVIGVTFLGREVDRVEAAGVHEVMNSSRGASGLALFGKCVAEVTE